jgi:lactate dehydrogenase-like 2-hydroxyacid dehydrogenase
MFAKVLICDLIGLKFGADGKPDPSEVRHHIEKSGGVFHVGQAEVRDDGKIHFYYLPDLSTEDEILALTRDAQFDAVIAAATFIPKTSLFNKGGVRIGAGTGNMNSDSWGGGNGVGGLAPLMNTPGFNSRATAQMTFKALLRVRPDLPVEELHRRSVAGDFDTGKNLRDYPTAKLEGKTIAILGYGSIGREVAKLAAAFGMIVKVYARTAHQTRIEVDGFIYASSAIAGATKADVVTVHTGLGAFDGSKFANAGLINHDVLAALNHNAVLLNYDRGECVDVAALDKAMGSGKIGHAAIDADIFKAADGTLSGPLVPYLPLAKKYPNRIELLPHAAADTDHPSRVAGAKQAVDQIIDCIVNMRVTNLKGDLPMGYTNAGVKLGTAN